MAGGRLEPGTVVGGSHVVGAPWSRATAWQLYRAVEGPDRRARALLVVSSGSLDVPSLERLAAEAQEDPSRFGVRGAAPLDAGFDVGLGVAWLALEPPAGEPLAALVASRGPLPPALVSAVMLRAMDVLAEAHERGEVHGALAPECLFVEEVDGRPAAARVTVLGIGLARRLGADASPAGDLRALGHLALWALSGGRASPDGEGAAGARLRAAGVTDPPSWFDPWFEGCVSAEPGARFASVVEAEAAWEHAVVAPSAPRSRRWAGLALVAVSGLAVALTVEGDERDAVGSAVERARPRAAPTVHCPAGMRWVPGGQSMMGSREGRGDPDQHPRHVVSISGFCLDATEVTVGAYGHYWSATGHHPEAAPDHGLNCNWGRAERAGHPVNCVDWQQAAHYCAWSGHPGGPRALPTEAQWEFAARGPAGGRYPWGSEAPGARPCWSGDAPRVGTCPAGAQAGDVSAAGVFDLAGNVSEWTAGYYSAGYEPTIAAVTVDPTGPASNAEGLRVFRGGSWAMSVPTSLRAANRGRHTEAVRSRSIGFRCARRP